MSTATLINNATTVASIYEAFGRRDIPFILDHISDDCTWTGAGEGFLPQAGTYKGKEVMNFFMRLGEHVNLFEFNVKSIQNINAHEVVAFGNMRGTSLATGKESASEWAMHWKFNDAGKVNYYRDYHDTAAAYMANQP